MPSDTRQVPQAPGPAGQARAVLGARVSAVYGRLQRFRERYEAQLTPGERQWLRRTVAEVERYRAMLGSSGRPQPADGRARRHGRRLSPSRSRPRGVISASAAFFQPS
jgi:hypothetical protein